MRSGFRLSGMVLKKTSCDARRRGMGLVNQKCSQEPAVIVENVGWLYMTRNGLRRSAMILEDLGWLKLTRNGLKRPGGSPRKLGEVCRW